MVSVQLSKAKRLAKKGQAFEAAQIYNEILVKFPNNTNAKSALANLKITPGIASIEATPPQSDPDESIRNMLSDLFINKNYDELIPLIEEYLPIAGDNYDILFLAGATYKAVCEYDEAMYFLTKCLNLKPFDSSLHTEIGSCLYESGDVKNAFKTLKHAAKLDPKNNLPILILGKMYGQIENKEKALHYFQSAVDINPSDRNARNEFGRTLHHFGHITDAIKQYKTGLLQPIVQGEDETEILLLTNLLNALGDEGHKEELKNIVHRAEQTVLKKYGEGNIPAVFSWNLGLGNLILGETEKGWAYFRDRFEWDEFPSHKRTFTKPRLKDFDELKGRRLMIWREQGIGDELTHLFLLNAFLSKIDGDVVVEVSDRLISILRRSFPKLKIRKENYDKESFEATKNDFDFELPMGDIAPLLNYNWSKSALAKPYIKCDKTLIKRYADLLDTGKPKVGIAWGSGFINTRRLRHYSKLKDWEPLMLSNKMTVVNLQYGPIESSLEPLTDKAFENLYLPECDLKNNMEEVFAIIKNCDLIVCPTTAIMIQAAALGVETISYSPVYLPASLDFERHTSDIFKHPWLNSVEIHKINNGNKAKTIEMIIERVIKRYN